MDNKNQSLDRIKIGLNIGFQTDLSNPLHGYNQYIIPNLFLYNNVHSLSMGLLLFEPPYTETAVPLKKKYWIQGSQITYKYYIMNKNKNIKPYLSAQMGYARIKSIKKSSLTVINDTLYLK